MKIDKAIEILSAAAHGHAFTMSRSFEDSCKLGIEAMKRLNDMRISPCTTADEILPGETYENGLGAGTSGREETKEG